MEASDMLRGRTHRCQILGIGHQRSRGVKGGVIVDMEEAENAIRLAVDAAERMAGVQVESVIVNVTGGRIGSQHYAAKIGVSHGGGVGIRHSSRAGGVQRRARRGRGGRCCIRCRRATGSTTARGIRDPKGMFGDELGADMHVVSCDAAAARNLMLAVERCHLGVEAMVATPYASGLSALVDDEAEMGTALIDLGGGTTSIGMFAGGSLTHVDAMAVGGNHITMDIARGLNTRSPTPSG
jgi:cell division protein FtsA